MNSFTKTAHARSLGGFVLGILGAGTISISSFNKVNPMLFKNTLDRAISTNNFTYVVRVLASLLIFVILVGFLGGIVKMFWDLRMLVHESLEVGLKQLLLNALILLAVIEVLKTGLSYLSDGRVRVTYIVDTVLIVMLNEIIAFWFKGDHGSYVPLVVVLMALIIIRILAITFSPDTHGEE